MLRAASRLPPRRRFEVASALRYTLVLLVAGLGACAPSGGDDWRDGQTEDHVDPGPGQVASALALDYVANGGAAKWSGVRVWHDRDDGGWVYTERTSLGQASERTVYRVDYGAASRYVARVYAVPDGLQSPRETGSGDPLEGLAPGDLIERPGCALVFQRTGPGDYLGTTDGAACPPTDPAASHAVTEIRLGSVLSLWTRDVAADGAHVGGPEAPTVYAPTDG